VHSSLSGGDLVNRVIDVTEPHCRNCIGAALVGTLPGLFNERVTRSPAGVAYRQFDGIAQFWRDYTWESMRRRSARLQLAMQQDGLKPGDRVAILLPNGIDWVGFDMAALGLGLVVVPLYAHDSVGNISYILGHSGARFLLVDTEARWRLLAKRRDAFPQLSTVWNYEPAACAGPSGRNPAVKHLDSVLAEVGTTKFRQSCEPSTLATIIYTSGTTGRPKGTMLSHFALLWNAEHTAAVIPPRQDDLFLSHLPLAHAFERTVGYYLPMMGGSTVAYARSIDVLAEDLRAIRPTVLLSVPRIYERVYGAIRSKAEDMPLGARLMRLAGDLGWHHYQAAQGRGPALSLAARLAWRLLDRFIARPIRDTLGGRLRVAVSGGAPLATEVARFLVAMGLPLVEGYGLTEAGPVVTATALGDIWPGSAGGPLAGTELAVSAEQELLVRSPAVMSGYWRDVAQTAQAIDPDGWLHTGDLAEISNGHLVLHGRLHDVQVLATGEKINAGLVEDAITKDRLFDQAVVIGEGKPFLVAVCTLNSKQWGTLAAALDVDAKNPNVPSVRAAVLARLADRLENYPRHAQVKAVHLVLEPWTIEAGILTPSLKVKRNRVEQCYHDAIEPLFAGHPIFR
jgi:long-chain acyl-CoA synthetase